MTSKRIGIDLMGGDTPPLELFTALKEFSEEDQSNFVIFAAPSYMDSLQGPHFSVPCRDTVSMHDRPTVAFKEKKNSSLQIGLSYLKEKKIDAFVTTGNTGALLFAAHKTLKTLKNFKPALLTVIPGLNNEIALLDAGASLSVTKENLYQFAQMGIAYQKARGIKKPKVALLNIGQESSKGTPQLRECYQKLLELNQSDTVFIGNIEGSAVFHTDFDVLISDGFSGNLFLKTAEGTSRFMMKELQEEIENDPLLQDSTLLNKLKAKLNTFKQKGALLCGVQGIVIKCHGHASKSAFKNGIKQAISLVNASFLNTIDKEFSEIS